MQFSLFWFSFYFFYLSLRKLCTRKKVQIIRAGLGLCHTFLRVSVTMSCSFTQGITCHLRFTSSFSKRVIKQISSHQKCVLKSVKTCFIIFLTKIPGIMDALTRMMTRVLTAQQCKYYWIYSKLFYFIVFFSKAIIDPSARSVLVSEL